MEQDLEKNTAPSPHHSASNDKIHRVYYTEAPNTHYVSQVPNAPFEKLGNPGPLGLFSFAVTTFMLGLFKCGAGLPDNNPAGDVGPDNAVLGTGLFMGGIAQFAAGMWEIRVGNSFGGTLHTSVSIQPQHPQYFLKTSKWLLTTVILVRCILVVILLFPYPRIWHSRSLQRGRSGSDLRHGYLHDSLGNTSLDLLFGITENKLDNCNHSLCPYYCVLCSCNC